MQTIQAPQIQEEKEIRRQVSQPLAPKWMQPMQFMLTKPQFLFELCIL